jgi:hypothetical protein
MKGFKQYIRLIGSGILALAGAAVGMAFVSAIFVVVRTNLG